MAENDMTRRTALGAVGAAVGTLAAGSVAVAAQEGKAGKMKLFDKVDPSVMKKGAPPIVFYPVPEGQIVFKTMEELKAWEEEVRARLGVQLKASLGSACETCSCGCTDDCGVV
ncbi:MAG: hypothetical protein L0211_08360 [Planctomycetaceae bacterium]|nr:hypothetical protein [Planctomycetaceae bacterium]